MKKKTRKKNLEERDLSSLIDAGKLKLLSKLHQEVKDKIKSLKKELKEERDYLLGELKGAFRNIDDEIIELEDMENTLKNLAKIEKDKREATGLKRSDVEKKVKAICKTERVDFNGMVSVLTDYILEIK